jgi:hypothetical protein
VRTIFFLLIFIFGAWWCRSVLQEKGTERFSSDRIVKDFIDGIVPFIVEDNERSCQLFEDLKEGNQITFDYLGHGTQAVAFVSSDNKYVLKFFLSEGIEAKKRKHFLSPLRLIPGYRKERIAKNRSKRANRWKIALESYAFAFEHMKEESGLISMHLHPSSHLFPRCIVRDRYGKGHDIDLDRTVFVLQKKTTLVPQHFSQIQSLAEYQKSVVIIEQFFENRARKGIFETKDDFPLEKNYGFLDGHLIFLDPGRIGYSRAIEENPHEEIERMKTRLHQWLANRCPARFAK